MKRAPPKKYPTTTSNQHALNAGSCLLDRDFLFVAENVCLNADSQVCCSSTSPERTLSNSLFIALQFKKIRQSHEQFCAQSKPGQKSVWLF